MAQPVAQEDVVPTAILADDLVTSIKTVGDADPLIGKVAASHRRQGAEAPRSPGFRRAARPSLPKSQRGLRPDAAAGIVSP